MRGLTVFALGAAMAAAFGWLAFPCALYVRQVDPLEFRHHAHAQKSGVASCSDCHALKEDGEFAGIPRVESCATCHAERIGTSKAEAALVDGYIKTGREIPWRSRYRQPANVWFSHAIHTQRIKLACKECHGGYGESDAAAPAERNRISSYEKGSIQMSRCEGCHRERKVEVSCLGCHK